MKNLEELLAMAKLNSLLEKKEDEECKKVLWALAIVGAIAVIAGIAAAVYHYLAPDYLDDIEDEFEDDFFEDEDEEDEEVEAPVEAAPVEEAPAEE
ncbi:MAG: DUF4366 domain-containing protein [Eubacteriales bacterium]|nr:DUF4366 domain-containing protein [Eubacteriales bacterium]